MLAKYTIQIHFQAKKILPITSITATTIFADVQSDAHGFMRQVRNTLDKWNGSVLNVISRFQLISVSSSHEKPQNSYTFLNLIESTWNQDALAWYTLSAIDLIN